MSATLFNRGRLARLPAPPFELAQAIVGGYVEVVRLGREVLLVNEDGLSLGLPVNEGASARAGMPIAGPAILLSTPRDQRRTLGADFA